MTTNSDGKIKNAIRDQHQDRRLVGGLFSALPPADPHLVGLDAQDLTDQHAQLLGLDDRRDKCLDIIHAGASAISLSASRRERPSRVSVSARLNSSKSSLSHLSDTRVNARSNARPASTLIVSRSSASGSALRNIMLALLDLLTQPHPRQQIP